MIDIAWTEFLIIGLLALILLGPKELPVVLRTLGRWLGRFRVVWAELTRQLAVISEESSPKSNSTTSEKDKHSS